MIYMIYRGQPKSYQLKIEDIKICRKSPYHSDSTYSEFPIKTKICFPAPYEIENTKYKNHKPFAYTILQQDLEMYHSILRTIQQESKRRLSQQQHLNEVRNNFNRNTPRTKQPPNDNAKRKSYDPTKLANTTNKHKQPLNLMDPEDSPYNEVLLFDAKMRVIYKSIEPF